MNSLNAHAVILNPYSNGGRGLRKWRVFLDSPIARELALPLAAVFDGSHISPGVSIEESLEDWLVEKWKSGCRNFVAAGGDGTVHLLLNGMMRIKKRGLDLKEFRLGAVGLGSSNDFHKPFSNQWFHKETDLYYRLDFSASYLHDVGQVEVSNSKTERFFVINSSMGVTAQANLFFNEAGPWFRAIKRTSVDLAIGIAAAKEFFSFRKFPVRVLMMDGTERTVDLVNLGVTKNPYFAGSFRYDLPQRPNDGTFAVHICEGIGKKETLKILYSLSRGKFSGLQGNSSFVTSALRIQADSPFALETDGEVSQVTEARFKVLPQEVLLCPGTQTRIG